ncbi:MAG: CaiB/BaiF CoA-transferase family protein [Myxococcota bacterium]
MESPLAGIRVLDLSRLLPGPFATMVLSDLGAQVDKVEDPRGGDYLRRMPPGTEMSAPFVALNRGKRSVVLDLKSGPGREAFLQLTESYDVLVESFRPGVMARLGLGYEALRARNPRLVYCAISGYGQDGPLRDRAGHDLNYLARAGVLGLSGPEDDVPQVPPVQIADIGGGGLYAVIGILAALEARHRTGEGRMVDVSMCEGALSFAVFGLMNHVSGFSFPRGQDPLAGGIAPYGTYATRDGRAVALAALEPKFWGAFCAGVGIDPDPMALMPGPHQAEWKARLRGVFAGEDLAHWVAFSEANDCCLEPVLTPSEVRTDPQHVARKVFVGADPSTPRTPVAPTAAAAPAPTQGEHTEVVLREAGLSEAQIAQIVGNRK